MNIYTFSGLVGFVFFIYLTFFIVVSIKMADDGDEPIPNWFILLSTLCFTLFTSLIIYGVLVA